MVDNALAMVDNVVSMKLGLEVYLSPMTLQIQLEREAPIPLYTDQAAGGMYR